jgi:glycosyltransferase involved in cell wall biosynthesis
LGLVNPAPTLAIVIPCWNSLELLPPCLDSLAGQGVEAELLVVDNGSADGSLAYLRERGVPHLALPENIGFAAAVNLGARSESTASARSRSCPVGSRR